MTEDVGRQTAGVGPQNLRFLHSRDVGGSVGYIVHTVLTVFSGLRSVDNLFNLCDLALV
jgi:hypothetical protein